VGEDVEEGGGLLWVEACVCHVSDGAVYCRLSVCMDVL
jgi:hypothetical protein